MDTTTEKTITWFKAYGQLFATLAEAQHECFWRNPQLLDDDIPDFFNSHIEEIETSKWNGFGNARNWADWHGEP